MTYELWDTESRNVIGAFDAEAAALEAVLEAVRTGGPESARWFALLGASADGTVQGIAGGQELIDLARRHAALLA